MIVIVDYQAGNIGSIQNMLRKIGHDAVISSDPMIISKAEKIILPGVGAFDHGMQTLRQLNLLSALEERKNSKIPILGICLGAQLMCYSSEEGKEKGLAWIDAKVIRFKNVVGEKKILIPHMGWNNVKASKESRLFRDMLPDARFYFVHSYYISCADRNDLLIHSHYGDDFDAAFERDNLVGVQFHPEKSHKFGQQLLKNFIECY